MHPGSPAYIVHQAAQRAAVQRAHQHHMSVQQNNRIRMNNLLAPNSPQPRRCRIVRPSRCYEGLSAAAGLAVTGSRHPGRRYGLLVPNVTRQGH
jgi:hypothetical protein